LNAHLMAGDSIYVQPNGRAELQLDFANFVRIAGDTELRIADMGAGRSQIQLSHGLITWRTLRDSNIQGEISTPAAAIHPLRMAAVRVEIANDGSTRVTARRGDFDISSPRGSDRVREGDMMVLRGNPDAPEDQILNAGARDGWDSFNEQRDGYLERAQSNRYVSPDEYGAEDLDQNGRWGYDPAYGNVWTPTVPVGWAPYRNGQWVWEDFYGWTWVDADPWGWAPFHYGSWYQRAGYGWTWFPGVRTGHYWWHPALVGFVGFGPDAGFGFGFGNIGWVPLAPFEVFHPWYGRGRLGVGRYGFVNNVNIAVSYRNAGFGGATGVSAGEFQRGQFHNSVALNAGQLRSASLLRGSVPVTPTSANLRFSDRQGYAPRSDLASQRFFSRSTPTASGFQRTPFAQQQSAVRSSIGQPGAQGYQATPERNTNWQRFGEPTPAASRSAAPSTSNPAPARSSDWGRFGAPQGSRPTPQGPRAPQGYAPPASGYMASPANPQAQRPAPPALGRPLQVSPPIVRQREAAPAYSRPQQSAPQQFRSAPAPQRSSGGGSHQSSSHGNRR
jgi:hypothetical protein